MSNYTSEARAVKQQYYGGYCRMCDELGTERVPYHAFTIEMHDEIKKKLRTSKDEHKCDDKG